MGAGDVMRRTLKSGMSGLDVEAAKRAIHRWNGTLAEFNAKTDAVRRYFQLTFVPLVKRVQQQAGIPQTGVIGPDTHEWLLANGWYDSFALRLLELDQQLNDPQMVRPIPKGWKFSICQGLHETGGIPGNWAIDWCAAPNTPVLSPEPGWVVRLSGRPPSDDTSDALGVFGWSIYIETKAGYRYFITHLGRRSVKAGQKVAAGDTLGVIGDQHYRPDHVHCGLSSPFGPADARKRITRVSQSPQVAV
jgi:murein DD-endopeptidase MepM/ murein hydrolase activator NlpD